MGKKEKLEKQNSGMFNRPIHGNPKMSRKEKKNEQKEQYIASKYKQDIISTLENSASKLYKKDYNDEYEQVKSLINLVENGGQDSDTDAVYKLDGYILTFCDALSQYIDSNNYFGIIEAIGNIESFVVQRSKIRYAYLTDPKYIKNKMQLMEKEVISRFYSSEIKNINARGAKMKELFEKATSKADKENILREMQKLQKERDKKIEEQRRIDSAISDIKEAMSNIEVNSSAEISDENLNMGQEGYAMNKEQTARQEQLRKMNEKAFEANGVNNNSAMTATGVEEESKDDTAALDAAAAKIDF